MSKKRKDGSKTMPSANHSKKGGIASSEETHYEWLVINVMPPSETESQCGDSPQNKTAPLLIYNDMVSA